MSASATLASVLAALVLAAAPIWAKPDIHDLGRQCRVGKHSACGKLAKIATEDNDASIRVVAVENLADPSLLAKIAVEDKDASVRFAAVKCLTDLAPYLAVAAIESVDDQALLARIALEASNPAVRTAARGRVTEPALLSQMVGADIKSIRAWTSRDRISFGPTLTVKFNQFGQAVGMQTQKGRSSIPSDDETFLIVEIEFRPSRPFELAASDVQLVPPQFHTGQAFGVSMNGTNWSDPRTAETLTISDEGALFFWVFDIMGRNVDPGRYKVSVSRAEFRLGDR